VLKKLKTWGTFNNFGSIISYPLKAVPLQAWSGPEGSRNLMFPDLMTTA
jgi:hypothetical protein